MAFSTTVLREYTLLKYVPNMYQVYGGARTPLPQFQWSRKLMPQNHSCEGGPQDLPTSGDGFAFKPISNQFKLIIFLSKLRHDSRASKLSKVFESCGAELFRKVQEKSCPCVRTAKNKTLAKNATSETNSNANEARTTKQNNRETTAQSEKL